MPGFDGQRVGSYAMDSSQDPNETGIVIQAARSGSGAMIDAVVAAMSELLTKERVGIVVLCRYYSKPINEGSTEGVGMVWVQISHFLSPHESATRHDCFRSKTFVITSRACHLCK